MNKTDKEILKIVATQLGDLLPEVVFVGGVTTSLYIEDSSSVSTTPTEDVDMIVNITSLIEYEKLERRLSTKGFKRDLLEPGPLCRYHSGTIIVDIMPLSEKILGFSNRWYASAYEKAELLDLDGLKIKILSYPYFLATKFEAFMARGRSDLIFSKDLEDIVVVLNGRSNRLKDLNELPNDIKEFVKRCLTDLLKDRAIATEAITACLADYGARIASAKAQELLNHLESFCKSTS